VLLYPALVLQIFVIVIKTAPSTRRPRKAILRKPLCENPVKWCMAKLVHSSESWNPILTQGKNVLEGHIDPFLGLSDIDPMIAMLFVNGR